MSYSIQFYRLSWIFTDTLTHRFTDSEIYFVLLMDVAYT